MGATIFRNHKVFRMDKAITSDPVLGGVVIVTSEHCSKNCFPHTYSAGIEFIGSVELFENSYLPKTAYFFDDGLSQSSTLKNGSAFTKHLKKLYQEAKGLTISDIHSLGYYGYSWPVEMVPLLSDPTNLKTFSFWLGTRCGSAIATVDDMLRMIAEAGQILSNDKENNIWMSHLWSLDREQVEKLEQAEEGTHFKVF